MANEDNDAADWFFALFNTHTPGGQLLFLLKCFNEDALKNLTFTGNALLFISKTIINYVFSMWTLFLLYLIYFRPYAIRPHVDTAILTAFDIAPSLAGGHGHGNTSSLRYDLALNVTFFNDHRIWAIRFKHFSARLYFNGTKLSAPDDTFPKFKARTRRHRTLHLVLGGRASNVSAAIADEFSRERAQGWFAIEVRLRSTLTYIIWPTRYVYYYEFECWLHFPTNAMPAVISDVRCSKGKRFGLS